MLGEKPIVYSYKVADRISSILEGSPEDSCRVFFLTKRELDNVVTSVRAPGKWKRWRPSFIFRVLNEQSCLGLANMNIILVKRIDESISEGNISGIRRSLISGCTLTTIEYI